MTCLEICHGRMVMKRLAVICSVLLLIAGKHASAQGVKTTLQLADLKNLQIYMEYASGVSGKLPDKETIIKSLKMEKGAAKLVTAIEDGSLILTGNTERESIWAYEKKATTSGGYVLSNNGIENLNAADAKKRIGK